MTTGFLYDKRFLDHDPGKGHPESKGRLTATLAALEKWEGFSALKPVASRLADESWIESVHSLEYIRHAESVCKDGFSYLDTYDVGICPDSYAVARLAAGGALALADEMMAGKISNGFALLRPPGHHAEKNAAMGFCLFNNIAILARYLQKRHGLDKVAILDWDVHHGNGTQHTFEEDPSVFYISLHQYPFYPGTGAASETGIGRGAGATLNCPMQAGFGDKEYERAFIERILPALKKFKPEAVLISAGFDAHKEDLLAHMGLSTDFFGWMSTRMIEIADQFGKGRLLSLLEGGYHLEFLPKCVKVHLAALSNGQV